MNILVSVTNAHILVTHTQSRYRTIPPSKKVSRALLPISSLPWGLLLFDFYHRSLVLPMPFWPSSAGSLNPCLWAPLWSSSHTRMALNGYCFVSYNKWQKSLIGLRTSSKIILILNCAVDSCFELGFIEYDLQNSYHPFVIIPEMGFHFLGMCIHLCLISECCSLSWLRILPTRDAKLRKTKTKQTELGAQLNLKFWQTTNNILV